MCFNPYFYGFDFNTMSKKDLEALLKRLNAEVVASRARLEDLERVEQSVQKALTNKQNDSSN